MKTTGKAGYATDCSHAFSALADKSGGSHYEEKEKVKKENPKWVWEEDK